MPPKSREQSRGDQLQLEAGGDPAAIRITVGQKRAVLHILANAAKYRTPDELAEAIAVAVVADGDDKTRYAVVTLAGKELNVYGPYASYATAAKIAASGHCAFSPDTRATIRPLINAPKSLAPKAPAKKATGSAKKKEMS